jgi:hypothetical protein
MKTISIVAGMVAIMALSSVVEAKTVLSAKERCFHVGDPNISGGWSVILKIKPQQALTDKRGAIAEIVGLERGSLPIFPPLSYYNQFAGAGSYIAAGDQEVVNNIVQIALVGTSYGTSTAAADAVHGVWSLDYTLMLEPEKKGKIPGGRLVGEKTFKPTEAGHKDDPEVNSVIDEPVNEISCKDF